MSVYAENLKIETKSDNKVVKESVESILIAKKIKTSRYQKKGQILIEDGSLTKEDCDVLADLLMNHGSSINELQLDNCKVDFTSNGKSLLTALQKTESKLVLGIQGCKVDDSGIVEIAEILKSNPNITSLGLQSNSFGAKGAIAIAEALKLNHKLTELSLAFNNFGNEGAIAIEKALHTNKTLSMCWLAMSPMSSEIHEKIEKELDSRQPKNKKGE